MTVCDGCQKLDIAQMLSVAALRCPEALHNTNPEDCQSCFLYEYGVPLHDKYGDLEDSAENGCDLCILIKSSLEPYPFNRNPLLEADMQVLRLCSVTLHPVCHSDLKQLPMIEAKVNHQRRSHASGREMRCTLEPYASRDELDRSARYLLHTAIHPNAGDASCSEQAADWLRECTRSHHRCIKLSRKPKNLPSRFIDVGTLDDSISPHLCKATTAISSWVALSYCWGGASDFVLNDKTAEFLQKGISLAKFPSTLRDAVLITRNLGIRHLWIDALCIKQDSSDDWLRESVRMQDVYRGATVTLIAGNSPSVQTGILLPRNDLPKPCPLPWRAASDEGEPTRTVSLRSEEWRIDTETWPIRKRGWTLQEDWLSPRTLSYSNRGMVWHCKTHRIDESSRITTSSDGDGHFKNKKLCLALMDKRKTRLRAWTESKFMSIRHTSIRQNDRGTMYWYKYWMHFVNEYTQRKLTDEKDMLPGLAGLAAQFADRLHEDYFAGLWRRQMVFYLRWTLDPDLCVEETIVAPLKYRAPSWSWASVNSKGIGIAFPSFTVLEHAKVTEVYVVPRSENSPFGEVRSGFLILTGRLYNLGDSWDDDPASSFSATKRYFREAMQWHIHVKQEFDQKHRPFVGQTFALLQLTAWEYKFPDRLEPEAFGADYLVLETNCMDARAYRRIAAISLSKRPKDAPVTSEAAILKILDSTISAFNELDQAAVKVQRVKIN